MSRRESLPLSTLPVVEMAFLLRVKERARDTARDTAREDGNQSINESW
jgi:hypothetical protein